MIEEMKGLGGGLVKFVRRVLKIRVDQDNGGYIEVNGKRLFVLSTAIAAGDATTAPAGSIALTTNATGRKQFFVSDGSSWQDYYARESATLGFATIPTSAGANNFYTAAPFTGKLIAAVFVAVDALTASDTNYVTFSLVNITNSNAAMLAATDANTTKSTGGTAIAANTSRELSLHGTAGNLGVTAYDRLKFVATVTGTLGNSLTGGTLVLIYQRTI